MYVGGLYQYYVYYWFLLFSQRVLLQIMAMETGLTAGDGGRRDRVRIQV